MSDRPLSVRIAAEIRKQLFLRDMTATQLGERAGMTQPYISRRLTGATAFDVDDLQRIAEALDVEIAELLPNPAYRGTKRGIKELYVESADRPAAHAPDVRSRANRATRTVDHQAKDTRPSWTHAGATA